MMMYMYKCTQKQQQQKQQQKQQIKMAQNAKREMLTRHNKMRK